MNGRTWLSPFAAVWYRQFPEAAIPFKQLARYLKPLAKAHPDDRIAEELAAYLRKTPAQFLNLSKFAMAFGSWSRPEIPQTRRPHMQSADELDRIAGIPIL